VRIVRRDTTPTPASTQAPATPTSTPSTPTPRATPTPCASPSVESLGANVKFQCSFALEPVDTSGTLRLTTGAASLSTDLNLASKQLDKALEKWTAQSKSIAAVLLARDRMDRAPLSGRDVEQRQSFASRERQLLIGRTCAKQPSEPLSSYLFALRVSHDSARVAHESISFAQLMSLVATAVQPGGLAGATNVFDTATIFSYAQLSPSALVTEHATLIKKLCDKINPSVAELVHDLDLDATATAAVVATVTDFVCTAEGFWRPSHVHQLAAHIAGAHLLLDSSRPASPAERKQQRLIAKLMKSIAVHKRSTMRDTWRALATADFSAFTNDSLPVLSDGSVPPTPVLSPDGSVPQSSPPAHPVVHITVPASPPITRQHQHDGARHRA